MTDYQTDLGAEGKPQAVIPGAERASFRAVLERRAAEPLRPARAQRPVGADGGLFDSGERAQASLF